MPTRNRRRFVGQAILYFLRQDYPNRELIVIDDGEDCIEDLIPRDDRIRYIYSDTLLSIGEKRNLACSKARGSLIAHWDDDDWMASIRLSLQVQELSIYCADICGVSDLYYYSPSSGDAWQYRGMVTYRNTIAGCTILYWLSSWQKNQFLPINVGEDSAFLNGFPEDRIHRIADSSWYAGILHGGNTGKKNLSDPHWVPIPVEKIGSIIGADRDFYVALRQNRAFSKGVSYVGENGNYPALSAKKTRDKLPLVSCIMPTRNRHNFVGKSISLFLEQDYPSRELVVVDDGDTPVKDLIPDDSRIIYFWVPPNRSIGLKRNLACEIARGDIIALWDDDDWYGINRLSFQAAPLFEDQADFTGISECILYYPATGQFFSPTPQIQNYLFAQGVVGGTLVFWKRFWQEGIRFPDFSCGEDAIFQNALIRYGKRLKRLSNPGLFVYVRHGDNTWRLPHEPNSKMEGWTSIRPPTSEIEKFFTQDFGFVQVNIIKEHMEKH